MDWKDYGQLTEAGSSLRRYYGLQTYHNSDSDLDAWLNEKKPRCIIALLVDAMGISVMEKHLKRSGFFFSHLKKEITTVFPPTTTAATTSFRTGRSPAENGWLGWNQYFQEMDDNIILFREHSQYGSEFYYGFVERTMPYKDLVQDLRDHNINSESVWPIWSRVNPCASYHDLLKTAGEITEEDGMRFVYAYWDAFDTLMHQEGPSSRQAGKMINEIEQETEQFVKTLPADCALVIVADHSQVDVRQKDMALQKDMCACFRHEPALEPRTIAFYIKDGKEKEFVERFNDAFGRDYHLYTHAEVMAGHFFGEGTVHPRMEEFIGDYLAVAETDLQLFYKKGAGKKGDHAGGMKEEAVVPLILYTKI